MGFLFGVNVYVFIPMVFLLWLKIVKNCQKIGVHGNGWDFFVWDLKIWPKEQQNTLVKETFLYKKQVFINWFM